ncbi:MAG: SDR family NAD(P)-dependent oxidoreductase [Alphaproteobacteria bacterium]|nr:SDR family NAD(P)-dependent oxidoreductase [Alphaproteobacteria bacterium]
MVVLVTGCRSGFGLLVAVEAARRGHTVYAGLRDLDTAGDLRAAAEGLDVRPVQLDVTVAAEREAVVAAILAEHGRLDALVNNAGRALGGPLETLDEDELRDLIDVNVMAPWALCKAVLPAMRAQGEGVIVNISSVSGLMAMPGLGAYATSKYALEGMSEALWHEVAPFGVRVVLVEPGPFKTDIWGRNRTLSRHALDPDSPYHAFVERLERLVHTMAQDRAEDPEVVSRKVVDLLTTGGRRLRYVMGKASWIRLGAKRVLPEALFGRILQRLVAGE